MRRPTRTPIPTSASSAASTTPPSPAAKAASVAVRLGATAAARSQRIVLDSVIAAQRSALVGRARRRRRSPGAPRQPRSIALRAGDGEALGGGRSALKTTTSGGSAIVFDDRSGEIVSRCTGIAATHRDPRSLGRRPRRLQRGSLAAPRRHGALQRRRAAAGRRCAGPPLALASPSSFVGGDYAAPPVQQRGDEDGRWSPAAICASKRCRSTRRRVARPRLPGRHRRPLRRLPLHRHAPCRRALVGPDHPVPAGWTIGSGGGDHRICRFAADATAPARSMRTSSIRPTMSTSPPRSWRRISWSFAATSPVRPPPTATRYRRHRHRPHQP